MYNLVPAMAILAARNKYIRVFKNQHAVSPQGAITPENFGLKRRMIFKRLLRQGVISAATKNTFYLNESREQMLRKQSRKTALTVMALLILALLIMLILYKH